MKLYYSPGACSLADHIALIESGLPFETEKVDLKAKATESDKSYTDINPKGYVPALGLDDGGVLTENIAILSYIADRAGQLVPTGGMAKFRTLEALAYISSELHKGFKPFFTPDASDDDKAKAKDALGERFSLFEEVLAGQNFVLGNSFTIADSYLFVMLFWAKTKADVPVPARLTAFYDRLMARDSVRKALADEGIS
ncbi:glutathione transferase GstA [Novosphingobium sp. BL-52-GroH]|uniref:glutathione transferase GstA n=1 Tax=Novosphingobium sp. BL-52-GroH TaxID=3349877 RepID=UPI00384E0DC0